jgi:sugar phosphate permease
VSSILTNTSSVPRSRWWRVGILLFLIYLVAYADRSNISVAAPAMVEHLQLSGTITGVVLSGFFWGYVITQVPGGYLASRVGPKQVIIGALVIVGITACATGFAPNLGALLAIRFVMGLAEGAVFPSFAVMFVRWFPGRERGRAVSLTQYALPLSSALMAPLAGWMIGHWNFQIMFVLQGIPAFILAVVFYFLVPNDPTQDKRLHPDELKLILAERDEETKPESGLLKALARPIVLGLCVTYFLWITGMYAFGLWLPTLIKEISSSGIGAVGWLTAIPYAFATVALYFNSRLSDKASYSRGWIIATTLSLAGVAILVQHYVSGGILWQMFLLCIAAIGLYSSFGTWWTWVLSQVPRNQAGPSVGLVNFVGNFGGIVGPIVVGWAAGGGTLASGFYILGFVLIASAAVAAFLAWRGYDKASVDADSAEPQSLSNSGNAESSK